MINLLREYGFSFTLGIFIAAIITNSKYSYFLGFAFLIATLISIRAKQNGQN